MSNSEFAAANPVVGVKNVDANGAITGLEAFKGESVFVIRAPKVPDTVKENVKDVRAKAEKALENPKVLADQILAYARAHRELSLAQYRQFTEKYGNPADLVKGYVGMVKPEDVQTKVKELNTLVQKRLDEATKEMNTRYEKLEAEFEAAVDRLFRGGAKPDAAPAPATATATATPAPEPVNVTVNPEPSTDATPRKASVNGAKKPAQGKPANGVN